MNKWHPFKHGLVLTAVLITLPHQLIADLKPATTTLKGKLQMPTKVSEGIDIEGLAIPDAVVMLKGRYNYPRPPYPGNWKEMKPEQRREWIQKFEESDEYEVYQKKVAAAEAKRFSSQTKVAKDGSFAFEGLKPDWYELTASIMHSKAVGEPNYEHARAHALRQFFIKRIDQDHDLGNVALKVKNVLLPGDLAPDFTIRKYGGGEFKLSDFRGGYLLMDFWATWCIPCIAEIPNLEAAHEKHQGDHFKVLGLSVDEKIDAPKKFLNRKASAYLQGYIGGNDHYEKIRQAYGITSIPAIWLIGPDGKIIARDLRGKRLTETVEKVLNEQAAE